MRLLRAKGGTYSDQIKVISVNANGFRSREPEIRRFLESQGNNCVLAISDTRLKRDTIIRDIRGYSMIRSDKEYKEDTMATAGGVALLIPKRWSSLQVNLTTVGDDFEAIAVVLLPQQQNSNPVKLICIYNHPRNHFPHGIFTDFRNIKFNGENIGGFIVGDFNCPHSAFGSRTTNGFGSRLLQTLNDENLIYFDARSPTYVSNSTGQTNVLDFVIADAAGSRLMESCYVEGDVGSDHLPVVTKLSNNEQVNPLMKTNLTMWAQTADKLLSEKFFESDSVDENIDSINQIFLEAKEMNTRPVKQKSRFLPKEIRDNIKLRKTIMKNRKKAINPLSQKVLTKVYNRLNHKIQSQIREFDEREVERMCEDISNASDSYKMWKTFNKYKNKNKEIEEPETPLEMADGVLTSNNKEKVDEFARYLNSVHQTPNSPMFDNEFKRQVDEQISRETKEIEINKIKNIHIPQFDKLLSETKANSAPGEDGLSYDLIKLCSNATKQIFCNLINQCLSKNVFPSAWKKAKVRMVPKPGRDKKQACNYRPISLLACLGKLYERFIYAYLMKELNDLDFLNDHQAGFVKGRSTQEHLLRLSQGVYNGFKRRNCTLALFLDVKAAFDAVWKNGVKYKINKIGLTRQMKNILFSFLDDRTLKVCLDGLWSETVDLRAGTPQGSCLSPILYLIFVNDLTDVLDKGSINSSQFADDVGLWTTNTKACDAKIIMQREVKKVEEWCRKWFVTLSPIKSKLILFTKCPRHDDEISNNFSIRLFGENISLTNEADFLGVRFDKRLTWEPQTGKIIAKSYKRLNLLRSISAFSAKHNPNMMGRLYKSIIRSIFEYSSLCVINAAECHIKKLQLIQNQALRVILKTPAYVSLEDLHDCSGLPKVKDHLKLFATKRFTCMKERSPLIKNLIDEYNQVKQIQENMSALDIILG